MAEGNNHFCDEATVRSHIKILSDLEGSTKSAHKRIDDNVKISSEKFEQINDFINNRISEYIIATDKRFEETNRRVSENHEIIKTIYEINGTLQGLLQAIKQQSDQMNVVIQNAKEQEVKIESIEDKMETKESVARLHAAVQEIKDSRGENSMMFLSKLQWLLISLTVAGVFGIMWTMIVR